MSKRPTGVKDNGGKPEKPAADSGDSFGTDPVAIAGPEPAPAAGTGTPNSGSDESTRTRRAYKKRGSSEKTASLDLAGFAFTLRMIHDAIANATGQPSLALREEEAQQLADATGKVLAEFKMPISDKQQALMGFAMVSASIYGPRIYGIINAPKPVKVQTSHPITGASHQPPQFPDHHIGGAQ